VIRARSTLAVVVLALAASVGVALAHGETALRGQVLEGAFHSKAARGTLHYAVYLPPGYAQGSGRYPVVYFLHGLPASPYAYLGLGFVSDALEAIGRQAIVVWPQGARDGDSDPEYLDWGPGRNWETAIGTELPRVVDSRYRTIADRTGRGLVGLSAGGYGAVLLALHRLDAFSVIESWSGYFQPTNPSGTKVLPHTPAQNAHLLVSSLKSAFARRPTFFAFYVGREDSRFRAENERLDRELTRAHVPHLFRLYPGAHAQSVWTAHARAWLSLALAHLAPPTNP
jgi:enterochelin esterase-like enzyme